MTTSNVVAAKHLHHIQSMDAKIDGLVEKMAVISRKKVNVHISYDDDENENDTCAQEVISCNDSPATPHVPETSNGKEIPKYTMSRSIRTVVGLWKEWSIGFNQNDPSIFSLNQHFGSKWRSENSERTHYCRRKVIIDAIERHHKASGIPHTALTQELDNFRNSVNPPRALDWFAVLTGEVDGDGRKLKNVDSVTWGIL